MRLTSYFPLSWLSVFIICVALAAGCKKADTPDPDFAAKVAGRYAFTTITTTATSQSIAVTGGTVITVRSGTALDMVDLTLSYATASTSGSSTFSETKTVSLQQAGSLIDLYIGTTKVGTSTATLLTLTGYPFNNTSISLTGIRQ